MLISAAAMLMLLGAPSTIQVLTLLMTIAIGAGGGGLGGFYLALRQSKIEKQRADQEGSLGLREVDVEQFKALFPGGLGDAVEHWRDEAREVYKELEASREGQRVCTIKITELEIENRQIKDELRRAQARITVLEAERRPQ